MKFKNIKYLSIALLAFAATSCEKVLDINDNPNSPTESTPQLVLPQAVVATARQVPSFNTYGAQIVGYFANGGGVSGWGSIISYNFTTTNFNGLWSSSYDILNDLKFVKDKTTDIDALKDFYFASEIFSVYNYLNLVDTYNEVPYSEALQGASFLTPKYDKAEDIYKDLGDRLDAAIEFFKTNEISSQFAGADILFNSSEDDYELKDQSENWAKFANTIKLRMLLKAKDKVAFTKTALDDIGFLTFDAIVNPGFAKDDGKQNPMWNSWAYNFAGTAVGAASQYAITPYIRGYYDGSKISDVGRANLTYKTGITIPVNQLGYQQSDAGRGQAPSSWFRGTNATNYEGKGILKGPTAGQPIMLASESYFLQAEAALKGLIAGSVNTLFESGIKASYIYLNINENDDIVTSANPDTYLAGYKTTNVNSRLVNIDLATTTEQRLEAIITQKYIAANMLFGHESWNEYRRTGYPVNVGVPSVANRAVNFVSITSEATAADKLPTRILYPNTEFNYNQANVPTIDKYTSKIFWAK
ncbi:SusD/RagB family nutrient-binding outer membrane lipoprotein [Sphingobacterium hungaricum]|uniref:SusD/RagB family nutrient-binding outer membrane lipoprotein n=1 Tax=Sphingobacterium hungaricum TaxID=2082723 RepID=A0A928YR96_9SPHI|nr:SusD/RagB family nutrient-binding outer membrane lipoprotein [Sphingobacterium hungaricum]MBE8713128.1 SusD/RagB family nutrient-binding outer membrane lipoprotein [Sphingobacterium hungaricum]